MRTTLTIDDDVIHAAKGLAARENKTIGAVISALARQALQPTTPPRNVRNGIPLLKRQPGASSVSLELVNRLRDEFA